MRTPHRTGDPMHHTASLALTLGILASPVLAGPDADGYSWATITHAGNRPTNDSEVPWAGTRIGAVDYQYRIATTETSVGQWLEFVRAYEPFYEYPSSGNIADPAFASTSIRVVGGSISLYPGRTPGRAADMGWEFAARYCNWLHNGKVNEAWAFESGAYDASTFTINDDGTANHQRTRSDGARYWIPSFDEWVKAAYYDPNRYGDGQEGYWHYGNGSDTRPIGSLSPDDGGEQNAGPLNDPGWPFDVASFSDVRSPWGLLDVSGGVREWTDSIDPFDFLGSSRMTGGNWYSITDTVSGVFSDRLGTWNQKYVGLGGPTVGLRLASAIPSPGVLSLFFGGFIITARRRRLS